MTIHMDMKRIAVGFAVVIILLAAPGVFAVTAKGDTDAAGVARIGYVDFSRAINEVADGKRAKQKLKEGFGEKQREIERMQEEMNRSKEAIDRDRLLLSPEALREKESGYRQKFGTFQQKLDGFQKEMADKEHRLTQDILVRLRTIVRDIGKDEGYSLILERSQDVVIYAPEGNDLTERVIQAYDRGAGKSK